MWTPNNRGFRKTGPIGQLAGEIGTCTYDDFELFAHIITFQTKYRRRFFVYLPIIFDVFFREIDILGNRFTDNTSDKCTQ